MQPLRIAIYGTRGIPARYGGFETFAEELSRRLAARGHEVVVYGRRGFGRRGFGEVHVEPACADMVKVVKSPTIRHKYLETPLHAITSMVHGLRCRYDAAILCNAANSPFAWIAALGGTPVVVNVDGIERRRAKWNAIGRAWYRLGERTSLWFGAAVVADADVIAEYYQERYGHRCEVITYGARVNRRDAGKTLERWGLNPGRYFLYVSRLEPENNALGVVEAYRQLETDMPLVVVGDAPYSREYIQRVKHAADARVIFTGYQFEANYEELQSHCFAYIQATEVGGTHPALVEAMGYGNCIIANDTPEHREVLGESGIYYSFNDFKELASHLAILTRDTDRVAQLGEAARARAERCYSWDAVADQYERLLRAVAES